LRARRSAARERPRGPLGPPGDAVEHLRQLGLRGCPGRDAAPRLRAQASGLSFRVLVVGNGAGEGGADYLAAELHPGPELAVAIIANDPERALSVPDREHERDAAPRSLMSVAAEARLPATAPTSAAIGPPNGLRTGGGVRRLEVRQDGGGVVAGRWRSHARTYYHRAHLGGTRKRPSFVRSAPRTPTPQAQRLRGLAPDRDKREWTSLCDTA
jgi:hypothetical protein